MNRSRFGSILLRLAFTGLSLLVLGAFLSPLAYMLLTALKTTEQTTTPGAPLWPARQETFTYQGRDYPLLLVPADGEAPRPLALVKKGRTQAGFIDPAQPEAGLIEWQGNYRALKSVWTFSLSWDNFTEVWQAIDFPRMLFNTLALACLTEVGTLISCILVAYGFARFRIPGKDLLFILLISTIFLPAAVTLVPTYTFFVKIGWVGTWLPLIVPAFFANAYDVFLLRQFFMTIPREMDEAAKLDGAGPLRILVSILLPQSLPVVVAVAVFHLVWSWNEYFSPMIYLSTRPELQPIAVGIARFNGIHSTRPPLVQAASLLALALPVVVFIFSQRAFLRGVVITGVEK